METNGAGRQAVGLQRRNMHYRKWPNKTFLLPLLLFSSGIAWVMLGPKHYFFFSSQNLLLLVWICAADSRLRVPGLHMDFISEIKEPLYTAWREFHSFVWRQTRGFMWLCSLISFNSLERCHLHTKICTQKHNVWSSVVLGLGLQHVLVLSSLSIIAAIIRLAIIITFSLENLRSRPQKLHIVGKMISEQFQLVLVNIALKSSPFFNHYLISFHEI